MVSINTNNQLYAILIERELFLEDHKKIEFHLIIIPVAITTIIK